MTLVAAGLVLTVAGFTLLFGALGGGLPIEVAFVGFALGVAVGPLTVLAGLVAYAVRRPTAAELARQRAGDYRTWHFRPVGLVILVVALAGFVALGLWAEGHLPGLNAGRRPASGYIFAAVCVGLLSIRRVRNLVFYTGQLPAAPAATTGVPDAEHGGPKT